VANEVSEITRREISDYLTASETDWAGRFTDDDFLARLYDLTKMPSGDSRFKNAAGDIWQHRVNNSDWDSDWVFHDSRFNLLHASDEEFLRFLCESVHPVVRPSAEAAQTIVDAYNERLAEDGWELAEARKISGKPVFAARKRGERVTVFAEPTGWQKVDRQLGLCG